MAQKKPGPDEVSAAYEQMLPDWTKIQTLLDGTRAMRAAGTEYLPQHPRESNEAYAERLSRATLLNMLQMTVDGWVGKPFGDPVRIGDAVPEAIQTMLPNIDLLGNNIDVFGRNWFRDGVAKGFSHVLVEYPRPTQRLDGQPRTLQDDRTDKLRPYLVHVRPENLIFASCEYVDGRERLVHVRIREQITEMQGFVEVTRNRIRVLTPGHVAMYEERPDPRNPKKVTWVLIEEYDVSLNFIPLVTFYADRQGFMLSKPPLSDLADLNVSHWQSQSDQTAVLTVARFPIMAVSGAMSDDEIVIGPNQWLQCPDPSGKFYYVEHTGKAIAAGRQSLIDLEETMAGYGALFLKKRPGGASATKAALDTAETTSPLQDMALRFQDALNLALQYMADWIKLPTSGKVEISADFGMDTPDLPHVTALGDARKNKDISRKRYTSELHRMGIISDDFNFDDDKKLLDEEKAQALKDLGDQLKQEAALAPAPVAPQNPALPQNPGTTPLVKKNAVAAA